MKTIRKISISAIALLITLSIPFIGLAQHFGHGGGGGFHDGGGGGFHGGGGGGGVATFHGGGFNGGARNVGGHFFGGGREVAGPHYGGGEFHGNPYHGWGARPYAWHPYHPYYWGAYWHPFGYFTASLAADAILLSIADQQYYYENGVYYAPYNGGYTVVAAPVGAVVNYVPSGYEVVQAPDGTTFYYYGGAFYAPQGGSFRVVPAPVGAIVSQLPEGAQDQQINGQDYIVYNNTYYAPIYQNGQEAYQVVQMQ